MLHSARWHSKIYSLHAFAARVRQDICKSLTDVKILVYTGTHVPYLVIIGSVT